MAVTAAQVAAAYGDRPIGAGISDGIRARSEEVAAAARRLTAAAEATVAFGRAIEAAMGFEAAMGAVADTAAEAGETIPVGTVDVAVFGGETDEETGEDVVRVFLRELTAIENADEERARRTIVFAVRMEIDEGADPYCEANALICHGVGGVNGQGATVLRDSLVEFDADGVAIWRAAGKPDGNL